MLAMIAIQKFARLRDTATSSERHRIAHQDGTRRVAIDDSLRGRIGLGVSVGITISLS